MLERVAVSPHHEEPPRGGVSNGDFAQDEVGCGWNEARCQWQTPLILSEVEGYGPEKDWR
jgi:hypothetical protein